jgi:Putative Flp pilus-assembly TadE/G-like
MQYSGLHFKQKGQSLFWVLGFLATMAVTFAGVYSVGQTTSEKQKIVNAADAAAYTGAMVEARALNLTAYANRAEIANEVFIAQMVSLQSWVDYMKTSVGTWQDVMDYLKVIPFVNIIASAVSAILSVVETALGYVATLVEYTVPFAIYTVEYSYYQIVDKALMVIFGANSTIDSIGAPSIVLAAHNAADSVLAANVATQDGKLDSAPVAISGANGAALKAINTLAWKDVFHLYDKNATGSASDGRRNANDILSASRDQFSTERKGTTNPLTELFFGNKTVGACPIGELGVSKDGSTKLLEYERWEAQDTTEYYLATGAKCKKNAVAVGWGRSTAAKDETSGDQRTNPHEVAGDDDDHAYKSSNIKKNSAWTGVKALWDVKRDGSDYPVAAFDANKETLTFTIAASKQKSNIRNNEHSSLNFMNTANSTSRLGSTDIKSDYLNDQISAKAEAKIFFSRPANTASDFTGVSLFRKDTYKEVSNLYNPYWQVRLKNMETDPTKMSTSDLAKLGAIYGSKLPLAVFAQ